jgi:hypothetical protein
MGFSSNPWGEFFRREPDGSLLAVSRDHDRSGKWFVFRLKNGELLPPDRRVRGLARILRRAGVDAAPLRFGGP